MIKYAILCSIILINLTGCYENKIDNNSINSNILERSMKAQSKSYESFHEAITITDKIMIEQCQKDPKIYNELAKDSEILVKALDVAIIRL
jgi:ABC-type Fe3+-hydroxamate transport system substrate-binding protein